MKLSQLSILPMLVVTLPALAGSWAEGIPISIQKSDYHDSLHLTFIKMLNPVNTNAQCDSQEGVVIHDSNESSNAALTFALTALASGAKFRCYVHSGDCSRINGATITYPVCDLYPTLVK